MAETLQILAIGIISGVVIFIAGCLFGQWFFSRERSRLDLMDGQIAVINASGKPEVIRRKREEEGKIHA